MLTHGEMLPDEERMRLFAEFHCVAVRDGTTQTRLDQEDGQVGKKQNGTKRNKKKKGSLLFGVNKITENKSVLAAVAI